MFLSFRQMCGATWCKYFLLLAVYLLLIGCPFVTSRERFKRRTSDHIAADINLQQDTVQKTDYSGNKTALEAEHLSSNEENQAQSAHVQLDSLKKEHPDESHVAQDRVESRQANLLGNEKSKVEEPVVYGLRHAGKADQKDDSGDVNRAVAEGGLAENGAAGSSALDGRQLSAVDGPKDTVITSASPPLSFKKWQPPVIESVPAPDVNIVVPTRRPYDGERFHTQQLVADSRTVNEYRRAAVNQTRTTVRPRVELSAKEGIKWFDDSQYYGLKASADTRFKIRHSPIPSAGSPWPMPQLYQPSNTTFHLSGSTFELHVVGEPCGLLEVYYQRVFKNVFGYLPGAGASSQHQREAEDTEMDETIADGGVGTEGEGAVKGVEGGRRSIHTLNVTVLKECTQYPYLEMDESYDLEVKKSGVSIITREVWGALRAMETFSQLVYQDDSGQFLINKTYIHDYPRFKHRGVLLDTSRHFVDKQILLDNLEAMAQNKLNVFHWHIVDDQSFPFESKTFPDLTRLGAYDAHTHVYTQMDIAEIIEEARIRGIRVIPEFDTPGHTFSWGYGQDHLLTPCYNYKREPTGLYGPINPILKKTYSFLRKLFGEIMTVFKDKYVHLGGDEVPFDCWQSNPALQSFMLRNNITDIKDVLNLYAKELIKIVADLGKDRPDGAGYIVWQEMFDHGVKMKPDTIVQVWSGDSYDIDRVTRAGLRAIFSTCWYLDYIHYGQDWDKYYRCEQIGSKLDDYRVHNQSLLIGGEACLWLEYAEGASVMPRLWPRASAAAERLWSDRRLVDIHQAAPRIEEQRCRMIRRGLQVGVLSGPGYCKHVKRLPPSNHRYVAEPLSTLHDAQQRSNRHAGNIRQHREHAAHGAKHATKQPHSHTADPEDDASALQILLVLIAVFTCISIVYSLLYSRGDMGSSGGGSGLSSPPARSLFITVLTYLPIGTSPAVRGRRLIYIFVIFVLVWVVWSAPFWLHNGQRSRDRV